MAPKNEKDGRKGTVWVLDTETKGTGAEMVPLDRTVAKPKPKRAFSVLKRERGKHFEQPVPIEPARPTGPRRFKIVDVRSREVLAEDADARRAVEALRGVGSPVDVRIDVWDYEAERWRSLTPSERRALWAFR